MTRKIDPTEVRNTEIHRRVAAEIRRDPRVIEQAAARLERWMNKLVDAETVRARIAAVADLHMRAIPARAPPDRSRERRLTTPNDLRAKAGHAGTGDAPTARTSPP